MISRSPFLSDSAFAIADAEGWFEVLGLDVEFEPTRSPAGLLPALATGSLDVLFSGMAPGLFNLIASGEALRAVASGSILHRDGCTHLGLMVLADTLDDVDFDDPETLRGLRIGSSLNSFATMRYVETMVTAWGLSLDDVELLEVEREAQPAALGQGEVDATVSQEPWATTMKANLGAVSTNAAHTVLPNDVTSLVVFGQRLLDDRELGARVLAAYLLGEAQYREGATERNVEIMNDATGLEPDLLRDMCWTTLDSDGRAYEDELEDLLSYGHARGDVDEVLPPDRIWDHSVRDRALDVLAETGLAEHLHS